MLLHELDIGAVMLVIFFLSIFVPLLNIIMVLTYSQKAINVLKKGGVKVGLLGASRATLRELKTSRDGGAPPPDSAAED